MRPRGRIALIVGGVVLAAIVLMAILAPLIAPHDPLQQDLSHVEATPSWPSHLLGTDQLGRDVLSRVIYGSRTALWVAALSVLLGGAIGVSLGILAGYFRGWIDQVLSRLADIQLAMPAILLALAVLAFAGRTMVNLIAVITLTGWPTYFRVCRSHTLVLRRRPYVEASIVNGAAPVRVLWRHIWPGVRSLAVVTATLDLSRAVLMEAGLSFLGLGLQPPSADWGLMVAESEPQLVTSWWIPTAPAVGVLLLVFAANLVGDWLGDRYAGSSLDLKGAR
jgi:peptide/nickel transport system permease protein